MGQIVAGSTTHMLLASAQGELERSGEKACPFYAAGARHGQLHSQLGILAFGPVLPTADRQGEARSSFYWTSFFVISVESEDTFAEVARQSFDTLERGCGFEPCAAVSACAC